MGTFDERWAELADRMRAFYQGRADEEWIEGMIEKIGSRKFRAISISLELAAGLARNDFRFLTDASLPDDLETIGIFPQGGRPEPLYLFVWSSEFEPFSGEALAIPELDVCIAEMKGSGKVQ